MKAYFRRWHSKIRTVYYGAFKEASEMDYSCKDNPLFCEKWVDMSKSGSSLEHYG